MREFDSGRCLRRFEQLKLVFLEWAAGKSDGKSGFSVLKFLEKLGQPVAFDSILELSQDDTCM